MTTARTLQILRTGAAVALLTGCAARTQRPATVACAPADSLGSGSPSVDSLAGAFDLVVNATSGARTGGSTQGRLTLTPFPPPGRSDPVTFPLYGSATITPDSVGAVAPGAVSSNDPAAPGVLAIKTASGLLLRLGADFNSERPSPIEGPHFVLTVRATSAKRFTGAWNSGVPGTNPASSSGYFCAERAP